jgi:CheY-like chemotaxis protein/nitrogen-specific signal transduction histidine kinase
MSMLDADGQLIGYRGSDTDITELKHAENEIKLKNEQLLQANYEKDKFFSIIAHDLRGPFNGFLGFTKILAEELYELEQSDVMRMVKQMNESASNVFQLLENLLEWGRMKNGTMYFNAEQAQLQSLLAESLHLIQELASKKEIELVTEIPLGVEVFVDSYMLNSVVRNLASNAVKFTPRGGKVTISAIAESNGLVEFSVKDTGVGMSTKLVDNLFRLDVHTGRQGTEGEPTSGLGLNLCKEFIEKHNGTIRVVSEEGKGTTFYFLLPGIAGVSADHAVSRDIPEKESGSVRKTLNILIAEDDLPSDLIITRILKNISHEVFHAKSGSEAVEICRENQGIDFVLMDIHMPEMNGYDATREIRKFNKDVVIIAQTSDGIAGSKETAILSGCNDYIVKPLVREDLQLMLARYFNIQEL